MKWLFARGCGGLLPDLWEGVREGGCNSGLNIDSLGDVMIVLANFIQALLQFAGIAAVVAIVLGGIMYIASLGEPARTVRAKETIFYAVVGLAVSMGSYGIVRFIVGQF